MSAVIVRVPASLSNLGPGFDCLGLALRLYNVIRVERTAKQGELPDVFDEAAAAFFKRTRTRRFSFSCSVRETVPRSRGLGSSATVRLGLLLALNRINQSGLTPSDLFRLCGELEGHPDNAAPACFGGFTVARLHMVQRFDVSRTLKFVLLIPGHEVKTSEARRILPRRLARVDAVESCGNACAITAALVSRNYESLRGNFKDRLHQPFRIKLIPYLNKVISAAEKAGALGAFLSGSGSTIAAVTREHPNNVAAAMRNAVRGIPARAAVLLADNQGARIIQRKS
ncbi:MAG: homoserine kinase [Chthoniobacterales bacterium]